MTWFDEIPNGDSGWDRLAAAFPASFEALARTVAAGSDDTDPVLLELARLRIARLLRCESALVQRTGLATAAGLTEEQAAAVGSWPTSPLFGPRERACLALTEQFVMDAQGVSGAEVEAGPERLGAAGCYAFVSAVSVLETFQRACLTMGIEATPTVDELLARFPCPT